MPRDRYSFSLFCFILTFLLTSCGGEPVRRGTGTQPMPLAPGERPNDRFAIIKKKLALLQAFNESPYGGQDLALQVSEELRMELSRTGEFIVDAGGEQIFGSSKEIYAGGGGKLQQLSKRAKVAGINFVVYGRVVDARIREQTDDIGLVRESRAYAEAKVELRVYDVAQQKEIMVKTFQGFANDKTFKVFLTSEEDKLTYRQELLRYAVRVATRRIVPEILDMGAKLDWSGRVAKIVGNRIYLNAGRASGLQVGDILKVMTDSEEIYDPETGALIGTSRGQVKGTVEIVDYFGPDGATAVLHSGGNVAEGDFVMLY